MNKIIKQLQFTSNLGTIDRLLRIKIDEQIAIKHLPQLSLATKYHLLNKGSRELQQLIMADLTKKQLPENFTFGQLFTNIFSKILNAGIKPDPPAVTNDLLNHLQLGQKIQLFNKIQHKYFNDNIKEELLIYIEEDKPINIKSSQLLKWLYFQEEKCYSQYLPIIVNIILHQQDGKLSFKAHKYLYLQYEKMKESNLENVQLFLQLYQNMVKQFMETKNTRNSILLKLKLNNLLKLNYQLQEIKIAAKRYNNLEILQYIEFYQNYNQDLEWLLQEIIQKQVIQYKHKTKIVALINHILKNGCKSDYHLMLFDQIMNAFEPEEVYYSELKNIFEFLLIIKDYPTTVLIQLFRIFADKHFLFNSEEFADVILLVTQFEEINIQDESSSYKASIYDEVREFYLKHAIEFKAEIHQIFIQKTVNKLK